MEYFAIEMMRNLLILRGPWEGVGVGQIAGLLALYNLLAFEVEY